jgi:hypothetical protein
MFVHCCHCRDCQRQTGSAFVINALYEATRVAALVGRARALRDADERAGGTHGIYRCPTCGTGAVERVRRHRTRSASCASGRWTIRARFAPTVHIYTRSKQPWVALPPGVPRFEAFYDAKQVLAGREPARRRALFPKPAPA